MAARFSGIIFDAVTEIKRRKITGEENKSFKKTLSETSHTPSKIYWGSLAKMSPSYMDHGNRGPTAQAIANIKNEMKLRITMNEFNQLTLALWRHYWLHDVFTQLNSIHTKKYFLPYKLNYEVINRETWLSS